MNINELTSWFEECMRPLVRNYIIDFKFFETGDLGSLNRITFDSELSGGAIELWSSGWIGLHFVDYKNDIELLNLLENHADRESAEKFLNKIITYFI